MDTPAKSDFRACALASGLVIQADLDEAQALFGSEWAAPRPTSTPSDRQLAEKLVKLERINRWQADQLLAGRSRFSLGPYRILDSIGQGGMGLVFKAQHTVMDRIVAIKVLPKDRSTPEAIARFRLEIRAQAQLDHENLVRALDAGHDGNVHFLVTEYVPGTDLRRLIRSRGRLDMPEAASIIFQAARGLHHAHQKGMVHRDVKPGNLLVTPEGHTKLSDLGLVGFFDQSAQSEFDGKAIIGTADFVAPEQVGSRDSLTAAADIYGLGCTLYYAVTGKVPFPGGTAREKARAHVSMQPLDPRRLNPSLSDAFVDLIADMLAKDPKQRISSAAEVMRRLEPWVAAGIMSPGGLVLPTGTPAPPPLPASAGDSVLVGEESRASLGGGGSSPGDLGSGPWDASSQASQGTARVAAELEDTLPLIEERDYRGRRRSFFGLSAAIVWLVLGALGIVIVMLTALVMQTFVNR